ncbi:hypothetical protein [Brevibacterium aurantiacum]|uniref:hypothetical protein n=1 Tax=Brevibacterium aurantiacum TaxID=273384 RepID=UPI0013FD9970|nr:hypothetical protein [Brevibacterium aurantiacum]
MLSGNLHAHEIEHLFAVNFLPLEVLGDPDSRNYDARYDDEKDKHWQKRQQHAKDAKARFNESKVFHMLNPFGASAGSASLVESDKDHSIVCANIA